MSVAVNTAVENRAMMRTVTDFLLIKFTDAQVCRIEFHRGRSSRPIPRDYREYG
jgi:hypothetical protein